MAEPESVDKILSEMPTTGRRPQNQTTQVELCRCETCGSDFEGEVTTYYIGERERRVKPWECPACRERREAEEAAEREEWLKQARAEQRERWRRKCGIPAHLLERSTFDSFEPGFQDKALKNCLKYAQGLNLDEPRGYRSLILYSPRPGVGKTHLMVAIANYAIDHWNGEPEVDRWGSPAARCPIRFEKGPGLVLRIRATYSIREKDNHHEREEDIYNQLKGVKLLLLDDVGKEKPSDFTRQLYWSVIDERVTSGLPVVMTCRLPLDSLAELMGEDTVDRLYGMTRGQIETLTGESYRKLKKIA
jgi:DNA replication protein DnaC